MDIRPESAKYPPNAATITKLIDKALSFVTTDMKDSEIMSLALKVLPKIATVKVNNYCIPAEGDYQYAYVRNMSVLIPDSKKISEKLLNEYLPLD